MARESFLWAKKKSKLVSDDFLSAFAEEETPSAVIEVDENKKSDSKSKKKKNKDKDKSSVETEEVSMATPIVEQQEVVEAALEVEDLSIDPKDETLEQRVRREKPPSRMRFAESSQPGFVMMGLENVGLVFGNNEILADSSFSVSSGEKVGLVGPNGSGKTSQLRILAGEIEPTTGTVVKSSQNLRISFLRQEFLDSLDLKNTLREELLSSFVEEKRLLDAIAACEKDLAASVDDTDRMSAALDKLQGLQEQAISKGVYSIESKVDKIMDSIGFSKMDADALVSTFSGGWKMRIGLAKILLQEP